MWGHMMSNHVSPVPEGIQLQPTVHHWTRMKWLLQLTRYRPLDDHVGRNLEIAGPWHMCNQQAAVNQDMSVSLSCFSSGFSVNISARLRYSGRWRVHGCLQEGHQTLCRMSIAHDFRKFLNEIEKSMINHRHEHFHNKNAFQ